MNHRMFRAAFMIFCIDHFQVHSSVAFGAFTQLCNHHIYLIPGPFRPLKRRPPAHSLQIHPRPWHSPISFLCL